MTDNDKASSSIESKQKSKRLRLVFNGHCTTVRKRNAGVSSCNVQNEDRRIDFSLEGLVRSLEWASIRKRAAFWRMKHNTFNASQQERIPV